MYWLPLYPKIIVTCSLPYPQNECQRSLNNRPSCILGHLMGNRLQTVRKELLAAFRGKTDTDTFPAPSGKWVLMEHQQFLVLYLWYYVLLIIPSIHKQQHRSLYRKISTGYPGNSLRDSNNLFERQSIHWVFSSSLAYKNSQNDVYKQ